MATENFDEDAPLSSLHAKGNNDDNDPTDDLPDFRFLAALSSNSKGQIPKRGEKDFEPHGTKHQESVLDASRKAMHDALDYTRVHTPKSQCRAWYFGDGVVDLEDCQEDGDFLSEDVRGKGLSRNHVVLVETPAGTQYRTMGKATMGVAKARVWLLPEEALYLIERGNLDLWWPSRPLDAIRGQVPKKSMNSLLQEDGDDEGLPLSLQAAYSLLLGEDEEYGKVSLDKFTVYANLKRSGYVVLPAHSSHDPGGQEVTVAERLSKQAADLFGLLFGSIFAQKSMHHPPYGPLVQSRFYRSYNHLYRQLAIIPRHKPSPNPTICTQSPNDPFRVVYHLWKPARIPTYTKSNPGVPDFRIAIASSRSTDTPSLSQFASLLESTPWDPPNEQWKGPMKRYQRLKHGWRNVVLAVVDQGIISYLQIGEAAFGEEKLYEGFDRGGNRGGKKNGGRGNGGRGGRGGRGGKRGRGRGR